ncbi:Predicted amidohydrolase [Poseidonocella pacifica]|uniref:Predicted amidohydrolase n=1 Tax=Poseidonocella pacifica TaxID=871651 RepID=A0A1I0X8T8_9RHOB|nr:carbon-nitrogen hydrolase family protein [Poseidonocella pacifica]SFA97097.1 Predicted amidohydrolase [Poseidonocella pacifica]
MKVAAAAYPLDFLAGWSDYAAKLTDWVKRAAEGGAELLVFPEYGAMELATLAGADVAGDLERSLVAVSDRIADANTLHSDLASQFKVHILAGSAPVFDPEIGTRPVNRARLFAPGGDMGHQDKQIMTRFERDEWNVVGGGPLHLFETSLGRIGILICYDSEFPLLGRALADADILLVPSCTEALAGYSRVRIGARARALENQCVSIMSSTVGDARWSYAVDENTGRGGVFGPPDTGFPSDGIIAQGVIGTPGWTFADVDPAQISRVRHDGVVLNRHHWDEQPARAQAPQAVQLR